jgi:hypothetical protein
MRTMDAERTRQKLLEWAKDVLTKGGRLQREWLELRVEYDGRGTRSGRHRFRILFQVPEHVEGRKTAMECVSDLEATLCEHRKINCGQRVIGEPDEQGIPVTLPVTVFGEIG